MYIPDQRVVGYYQATTGEIIDIKPDGRIMYIKDNKNEIVGLVSINTEEPLSIRIIAPDTSPLIGTIIEFSENRKDIAIKWSNFGTNVIRPTDYHHE